MKHRLLACIVPNGAADRLASAANAAGAGGGTVASARGTAPNAVLQFLGLGGGAKELYFTVVGENDAPRVAAVVSGAARDEKAPFGIAFGAPVGRFARFGLDSPAAAPSAATQPQNAMTDSKQLVAFVVNKGFAEDAMAAARRAGAGGGTVVRARGTAKPDDETFFGVPLVPEKEMLLVVADSGTAGAVVDSVLALPCFAKRGSGIAFTVPVDGFETLGRDPGAEKAAPEGGPEA